MERVVITVNQRTEKGKGPARRLRSNGVVPAVVYSDEINIPLIVPQASLKILRSMHFSESAIITMKITGLDKPKSFPVLIKDIQFHPVTEAVAHIDFLKVSLKEKIKVHVPIVVKGEPKAVKDGEGVLTQVLRELEVEGLPLDLPEQVTLNVSELTIGHSIHVQDIQLPANVRIVTEAQETIVTLGAKKEEPEEVVAPEGEAPQEPEVIKEKKDKDKEAAEGQASEGKEGKKEAKEGKKEGKDKKE